MANRFCLANLINTMFRILRPVAHFFSDRHHANRIARIVSAKFPELKITDSSTILDLGSNRGRFARAFAKTGALIICFEPNPDVFSNAVKLLRRYTNVFHLQAAVSESSGITKLFLHRSRNSDPVGFSISASIHSEKENIAIDNYYFVPKISLESILENLPCVELLKIDIEGAEADLWPTIEKYHAKIHHLILEPHQLDNSYGWHKRAQIFIKNKNLQSVWFLDWE